MTGAVIGADEADYERRVAALKDWAGAEPDPSTWIAGTVDAVAARLRSTRPRASTGVYLQHLVHRDTEMVELIGNELVPRVR